MDKHSTKTLKEAAARTAVDTLVKSGMRLGLGTGTTAIHAVRRVGELLEQGILSDISAFPTSYQTEMECEKLGIPTYNLNSRKFFDGLDLTIDGADEVDLQNHLVKGGGGAILIEKLAAYTSSSYAIVVDSSKLVDYLGVAFPVPIEVIPEARIHAPKRLEKFGVSVILREVVRKVGPVITEHGNLLLDVRFPSEVDPELMENEINQIPGIVENGFFTRKKPVVFIAWPDGTVETRGT
jgi:ribose 5-phosphate isomerase A